MKTKNIIFIIFLILLVIFIGFGLALNQRASKINLAYSFNGTVEHIDYNNKGYPNITINGEQYPLDITWDYNHIIEVGDSLKKDSGEMMIKLVKHKNGKVLIFDHR